MTEIYDSLIKDMINIIGNSWKFLDETERSPELHDNMISYMIDYDNIIPFYNNTYSYENIEKRRLEKLKEARDKYSIFNKIINIIFGENQFYEEEPYFDLNYLKIKINNLLSSKYKYVELHYISITSMKGYYIILQDRSNMINYYE